MVQLGVENSLDHLTIIYLNRSFVRVFDNRAPKTVILPGLGTCFNILGELFEYILLGAKTHGSWLSHV